MFFSDNISYTYSSMQIILVCNEWLTSIPNLHTFETIIQLTVIHIIPSFGKYWKYVPQLGNN